MSASPPPRTAPLVLWRIAERFLLTLHGLFGNPEHVAAEHTHSKAERSLLLRWLRAGEALLRLLLTMEAAAFAPAVAAVPTSASYNKRPRLRRLQSADKPEEWRVSFRCFARAERPAPPRPARVRTPRRFFCAWPLAERYEALLRAYNRPAPYARRLARRMFAHPDAGVAMRPCPEHLPHLIGEQEHAILRAAAARAWRRRRDSS